MKKKPTKEQLEVHNLFLQYVMAKAISDKAWADWMVACNYLKYTDKEYMWVAK